MKQSVINADIRLTMWCDCSYMITARLCCLLNSPSTFFHKSSNTCIYIGCINLANILKSEEKFRYETDL